MSFTVDSRHHDDSIEQFYGLDGRDQEFLILFSCASTVYLSFLPKLIVEAILIQSGKAAIDSFFVERFLLVTGFALPNLIGLFGVHGNLMYFARLFQVAVSISSVLFAYITVRIIEQSVCKDFWTWKLRILLYATTCMMHSVVFSLGAYFTLKLIHIVEKVVLKIC